MIAEAMSDAVCITCRRSKTAARCGVKVEPAFLVHEEVLARARDVIIFFMTKKRGIPLVRWSKITVSIATRDDRFQRSAPSARTGSLNTLMTTETDCLSAPVSWTAPPGA